ncbi:MAG: SH3 domain-containing protein [Pseudomonadota bacterium]
MRHPIAPLFCTLLAPGLHAQALDVPIIKNCVDSQAACYPTSTVTGLRADGDGFLSVRTGPGSDFRKIGELVNGDVVAVISSQGRWRGVELRDKTFGWVHGNWLTDLAG